MAPDSAARMPVPEAINMRPLLGGVRRLCSVSLPQQDAYIARPCIWRRRRDVSHRARHVVTPPRGCAPETETRLLGHDDRELFVFSRSLDYRSGRRSRRDATIAAGAEFDGISGGDPRWYINLWLIRRPARPAAPRGVHDDADQRVDSRERLNRLPKHRRRPRSRWRIWARSASKFGGRLRRGLRHVRRI